MGRILTGSSAERNHQWFHGPWSMFYSSQFFGTFFWSERSSDFLRQLQGKRFSGSSTSHREESFPDLPVFIVLQRNFIFVFANVWDWSFCFYTRDLELPNILAIWECNDSLRKYKHLYQKNTSIKKSAVWGKTLHWNSIWNCLSACGLSGTQASAKR